MPSIRTVDAAALGRGGGSLALQHEIRRGQCVVGIDGETGKVPPALALGRQVWIGCLIARRYSRKFEACSANVPVRLMTMSAVPLPSTSAETVVVPPPLS
jgi:hypothetical protein